MQLIFEYTKTVAPEDTDPQGRLKLSSLLYYAQQISGMHSDSLGFTWDALAQRNMFWAVLRHRVVIRQLPVAGQQLTLQTWPMPATRAAYPRAVRALDSQGNTLFDAVSLWVLMDTQSRTMLLPGKSGVDVPGTVRGDEPAFPGSIVPGDHRDAVLWQVTQEDLDINNHVNNAKYLDHIAPLAGDFSQNHSPRELTVCYLSEVHLNEKITLGYTLCDGQLTVDGTRLKSSEPVKTERVFAAKIAF